MLATIRAIYRIIFIKFILTIYPFISRYIYTMSEARSKQSVSFNEDNKNINQDFIIHRKILSYTAFD